MPSTSELCEWGSSLGHDGRVGGWVCVCMLDNDEFTTSPLASFSSVMFAVHPHGMHYLKSGEGAPYSGMSIVLSGGTFFLPRVLAYFALPSLDFVAVVGSTVCFMCVHYI